MGRLVERLVVVNAEHLTAAHRSAQAAHLRREVPRPDVREHGERRQAMEIGNAYAHRGAVKLRIVPGNWEKDRSVGERAEIVRVVRVLPQVVCVYYQVFSKRLLKARIKLVSLPRANRRERLGARAIENGVYDGVLGSHACQYQVLIERGLQDARVRKAQNRIGLLHIVCDTDAGLRLPIMGDSAIDVGAQSHIEGPIALRDGVLQIERKLLHVRMPVEWEEGPSLREIIGKQERARGSQGHAACEAGAAMRICE